MPSIWEMTNLRLVRATVTTRTMEALPMMTPRDVRIARSLLLRSASIATERVSRRSIMTGHLFSGASTLRGRFCLWALISELFHIPEWRLAFFVDSRTGGRAIRGRAREREKCYAARRVSGSRGACARNLRDVRSSLPRPRRGKTLIADRRGRLFPLRLRRPGAARVDCVSWHGRLYRRSAHGMRDAA